MSEKYRFLYLCTSNVCRSPLAESVARSSLQTLGIPEETVSVSSRGLTDSYSAWNSPAEPRMVSALSSSSSVVGSRISSGVVDDIKRHRSSPLTRQEVLDSRTYLLLVTAEHEIWARQAVGADAVDKAKEEGRITLIHSGGEDIPDPWFGDERHYRIVCDTIMDEVPKSVEAIIKKLGLAAGRK